MKDERRSLSPHDRILATATRLFQEQGIRAVSVRQIVTEAGVAQMTPYRRIGGKDQLVAATLEQSLIHSAAVELRGERAHPATAVIEAHQRAIRTVLDHLATLLGVGDPVELAPRLHLVLDGALAAPVMERQLPQASIRAVADAVLAAQLVGAACAGAGQVGALTGASAQRIVLVPG